VVIVDEPRPSPQDEQLRLEREREQQATLDRLNAEYRPKSEQRSSVGAFVTAGIELGLAVVLLTLGGWWLDTKLGTSPALVLVGAAFGITGGMYRIIWAFNQSMK